MFGMGTWEIALIFIVALLILGPDKLPSVARSIGKGMREMRRAANDLRVHIELDDLPQEPPVQTAPVDEQALEKVRQERAALDAQLETTPRTTPADDEANPKTVPPEVTPS